MMSEMIDRAAAVLAERLGQHWATMPDEARLAVRGHAVAVIEAIREPSEAMQDAMARVNLIGGQKVMEPRFAIWRAGIDELLKP